MLITLLASLQAAAPSPGSQFFPLQLQRGAPGELPALVLLPGALDALEPLAQVVLTGAPLADGRRVDLRLERADPDTQGIVVAVDGQAVRGGLPLRSEEHTSELQSRRDLVCRLLLEKKKKKKKE